MLDIVSRLHHLYTNSLHFEPKPSIVRYVSVSSKFGMVMADDDRSICNIAIRLGRWKIRTLSHPVKTKSVGRKVLFCPMLEYRRLARFVCTFRVMVISY